MCVASFSMFIMRPYFLWLLPSPAIFFPSLKWTASILIRLKLFWKGGVLLKEVLFFLFLEKFRERRLLCKLEKITRVWTEAIVLMAGTSAIDSGRPINKLFILPLTSPLHSLPKAPPTGDRGLESTAEPAPINWEESSCWQRQSSGANTTSLSLLDNLFTYHHCHLFIHYAPAPVS